MFRRFPVFGLLIVCLMFVSCGSSSSRNPVGPTPIDLQPILNAPFSITCPDDVDAIGTGASTTVTWDPPVVEGGLVATVTCTPASGSAFSPGKTTVECEAVGAGARRESCSFAVSIQVSRLTKVKYLAFGDSITQGFLRDQTTLVIGGEDYPAKLKALLEQKYPVQTLTMVNSGKGGETSAAGRLRLPGVLDQHDPEVLLLLEGFNHVRLVSPSSIQSDLRSMVRAAQSRRIEVILSTLTPVTNDKERESPGTKDAIRAVNRKIRELANQLKLDSLVDMHAVMDGRPSLFGSDGVHPNQAGYQVMAETFMDEIVDRFDAPPAPVPTLTLLAPPSGLGSSGSQEQGASRPPVDELGGGSALPRSPRPMLGRGRPR